MANTNSDESYEAYHDVPEDISGLVNWTLFPGLVGVVALSSCRHFPERTLVDVLLRIYDR